MAENKKSGGVLLSEDELHEIKKAIEEDDCSKLLNYIDKGWDVNQRLRYDQTALHVAAASGRTEVVRVLVQGGADVDVQDTDDVTPLHRAAWRGHTDIVKVMLANKASVDVRDEWGRTQLYWAAWCGHTDTVEVMLANKASVDVRDRDGRTPLYMAALRGDTDTVKVLMANKASVDVRTEQGDTPLHVASARGHTEVVKLLCMEGQCDVTAVNKDNMTALDVCGRYMDMYSSSSKAKVFRIKGLLKGCSALHVAAEQGETEVLRILLDGGADVDGRDRDGQTPLHRASERGRPQMVELLLANNASVDVRDKVGRTPLHQAAERGHTKMVELLLANKATVDVRDEVGRTPLHQASERGHTKMVELLLANKATVDVCDKDKKTAHDVCGKHTSAGKDEVKKIKTLLKKQMDLKRDLKKLEQKHGCAIEVRPPAAEQTTAGSSDDSLGACAFPTEKQCGKVVEGFAKSKGKLIPKGEADVILKVRKGNDGELDILDVDTRLSDFFPLILPPAQSANSTLFHDLNKKLMSAHLLQSFANILPSVVLIARSNGIGLGSGFRVGPTYVMTNYHVVKELSVPMGSNAVLLHFNKSLMQSLNQGIIHAAPILSVIVHDEDLDVAVVDLDFQSALPPAFNLCKRINKHALPPPLIKFKAIVGQEYVHFAGHPDGQEKVLDTQCKLEHITDAERSQLLELHRRSNNDTYKTVADRRRALYQCSSKFGPGSSGSPGFVADDEEVACLAVMHTIGHNIAPGEFRLTTVEQGVRTECIFEFINQKDSRLCQLIFPGGRPT